MSDNQTEIVLTKKQHAKIQRALDALESVRLEVERQYETDISWYLDGTTNLNLMEGTSHDGNNNPNRDMIIESFDFKKSGGGDW